MSSDLTLMGESPFDAIRREDERGEYWNARDLMALMGYSRWENFLIPVERAMRTAANTGIDVTSHFLGSQEMVTRSQGGGRLRDDYKLSRHAAYLTAMNGDPNKPEVAAAQAYFAVRTREAETAQPAATQLSRRDLAAMVIAEADRADAAERRAAELEPSARSWDTLAEAVGVDYAVADVAKILSRDPVIAIGRDRLFGVLADRGWVYRGEGDRYRPYQRAVDLGRLAERLQSSLDGDGARVPRAPQVRVTVRGIHELHKLLGGSGPVLLEVAS